jgi:hypothetical protein
MTRHNKAVELTGKKLALFPSSSPPALGMVNHVHTRSISRAKNRSHARLIRSYPFATVVTLSSDGLNANHIPFHLSVDSPPFGILQGHVARANPMWNDFSEDIGVLAVFHGPNTYISPSWYATKTETGRLFPLGIIWWFRFFTSDLLAHGADSKSPCYSNGG